MAARKTTRDMCVVTIGFQHLLLPADSGLKVIALLRDALEVERDYGSDHREKFIVGERPRCELQMISPRDVREKVDEPPPRMPRKPLLLGND